MSSRSSSNFPSFSGYHRVGWIKSAHGIRGEIFVQLEAGQADWLATLTTVSLLEPGAEELSSWKVLAKRPHKEGLILLLEGCADRNRSEELRKSTVYIPENLLVSEPGETVFLRQILDFAVADSEGRRLGVIRGFATNGPQDLLRVELDDGGREVLIPFVDDFIVRLDFDARELRMALPEGLLEM